MMDSKVRPRCFCASAGWPSSDRLSNTGQDLYFHLNHPVRWVQVAGVVVAIDGFEGTRGYTIDVSSGATVECRLNVPKQIATRAAILATEAEGSVHAVPTKQSKPATKPAETTTSKDEVKPVI